jgi:hypothetical protein
MVNLGFPVLFVLWLAISPTHRITTNQSEYSHHHNLWGAAVTENMLNDPDPLECLPTHPSAAASTVNHTDSVQV